MTALVLIENESGTLTRYETGGARARRTHCCTIGSYVDFVPRVIEGFRVTPPAQFKCASLGDAPKVA